MIRFGPSGNSDSFYDQGYNSSVAMPKWLAEMGLNAYEYQCSKGVNISEKKARELGEEARNHGIFLSIHAPYYINLASREEEKRQNSKKYILQTMQAASWMGAERIVIHPGSCTGIERRDALNTAISTLKGAIEEADRLGFKNIHICPETMGKINQLGDLEEVLELCTIDERLLPTLDFGHIHARGMGSLKSIEDFDSIFRQLENRLGSERLRTFHCHFSRIEFTGGGEKKHWTLDDIQFGPEFELLAKVLWNRKLSPVVICESRGVMAEDALRLKDTYESIREESEC